MIRYAVVGAGRIAQEAFLPAVATTGNSRTLTVASGSPDAAAKLAAARESGAYLMAAYQLHNEPGTDAMLEALRSGQIGESRYIATTFRFQAGAGLCCTNRLTAGLLLSPARVDPWLQ